ncbi:MAG: copper chaperone PCu(A)C [Hyphomicrobiales bacterium]|nr:copper chaperone PCu(A)C [Hyphomicrobiales bacterium]
MVTVAARIGLVGGTLLMVAGAAQSETYSTGSVEVYQPWARASPKGATVGAGYLTIINKGTESDRLVGGSAEPATRFEVHTMVMEGGVARMRPVSGIDLKPGATVELKPGGLHVMFMGLKQPLVQGQRVKGTLVFEKAGTLAVEFVVQAVGAPAPQGGHKH